MSHIIWGPQIFRSQLVDVGHDAQFVYIFDVFLSDTGSSAID